MQEILFRAKTIGSGEWLEGYYYKMSETTYAFEEDYAKYPVPTHHYILVERMTDWGLPNRILQAEVDPETVSQYTGLTDKNGRKIFEGDILSGERYHDWGQGGEYAPDKCVIKWNEKRAGFDPLCWWDDYHHDLKDYEVIGNIFDNPEIRKNLLV